MRITPRSSVLPLLLLLALGPLTSCHIHYGSKVWVTDTEEFSVSAEGLRTVGCRVHNGKIDLAGSKDAGKEVHVRAEIRAGGETAEDAERCMDAIELIRKRSGDTFELGWHWTQKRRRYWNGQVSFSINQPKGIAVRASTHNGVIHISDIDAACRASAHNGSITVTDCTRILHVATHNGKIVAAGSPDEIQVETHNGGVHLTVANQEGVNGRVETHNGDVRLTLGGDTPVAVTASTHNGNLRARRRFDQLEVRKRSLVARQGAATGRVRVRTHNGSVDLR